MPPRLSPALTACSWIALIIIAWKFSLKYSDMNDNPVTNRTEFKDLFEENVTTYHWVCVEQMPYNLRNTRGSEYSGFWTTKMKRYSLPFRVCALPQKMITVFNHNSNRVDKIFGFKVHFTPRPIMYDRYELRDSAYFHSFLEPFEPENFFHLTKQFLFPLHYLIKATGQLGENIRNTALFQKPWSRCPYQLGIPIPMRTARYNQLFEMLGVYNHDKTSLFPDKSFPSRTCFKNAVFSSGVHIDHALDAITFFQEKLGIKKHGCPKRLLTIITRKNYRRILNLKQLIRIAEEMGYTAEAVAMEKLPLREQTQLVYCTEILVGVTGAGLQWAYFMRNHSGVIEIAWPKSDWLFFFSGDKDYNSGEENIRPLNIVQLSKTTTKRNLDAFRVYLEEVFYIKKNFTAQEALQMYKEKSNYHFQDYMASTTGKLFDVIVDPTAFQEAIIQARPGYV